MAENKVSEGVLGKRTKRPSEVRRGPFADKILDTCQRQDRKSCGSYSGEPWLGGWGWGGVTEGENGEKGGRQKE